jgi:hypothetical protein
MDMGGTDDFPSGHSPPLDMVDFTILGRLQTAFDNFVHFQEPLVKRALLSGEEDEEFADFFNTDESVRQQKGMLIEIFNKSIDCFAQMDRQEKVRDKLKLFVWI